jgi:hypothetical protein
MTRGLTLPSITTRLDAMILDEEKLIKLLEDAFMEGFSEGFHTEDSPGYYLAAWRRYIEDLKTRPPWTTIDS